jgi:hypothetical protein
MYTSEDGNLLSVCNRDQEPAPGWEKSSKLDSQSTILRKKSSFLAIKKKKPNIFFILPLSVGRESACTGRTIKKMESGKRILNSITLQIMVKIGSGA